MPGTRWFGWRRTSQPALTTVRESAKALAKREETSSAVSTVEAVLLSAKLCSFRTHLLQQTEGVFLPLPCIQARSAALACLMSDSGMAARLSGTRKALPFRQASVARGANLHGFPYLSKTTVPAYLSPFKPASERIKKAVGEKFSMMP